MELRRIPDRRRRCAKSLLSRLWVQPFCHMATSAAASLSLFDPGGGWAAEEPILPKVASAGRRLSEICGGDAAVLRGIVPEVHHPHYRPELAMPTITNDPRQLVSRIRYATSGGVTVLPRRANACVMPSAKRDIRTNDDSGNRRLP